MPAPTAACGVESSGLKELGVESLGVLGGERRSVGRRWRRVRGAVWRAALQSWREEEGCLKVHKGALLERAAEVRTLSFSLSVSVCLSVVRNQGKLRVASKIRALKTSQAFDAHGVIASQVPSVARVANNRTGTTRIDEMPKLESVELRVCAIADPTAGASRLSTMIATMTMDKKAGVCGARTAK
eukprot:3685182-Rhodomonas_salina.1